MKWEYSFKYLEHLALIVLTLSILTSIGFYFNLFSQPYTWIKMVIFTFIILFLADNIWENILGMR